MSGSLDWETGPNDHTIAQIKDAVRDGLRAVKNTIEDEAIVLGAGAFEVAARQHLMNVVKKTVQGVVFSIYPHLSMLQFSCDSSVLSDLFIQDQVFVFIFCALC
jgi:hypothetical protein